MHASDEQLLSLRDGEPAAADCGVHVQGCASCSARLVELRERQRALRALPDPRPDPDQFAAVRARVLAQRGGRWRALWLGAAATVLIAFAALTVIDTREDGAPAGPETGTANAVTAEEIRTLIERSRAVEGRLLTAQRSVPSLRRAETAAAVAVLEEGLAGLDLRLSRGATAGLAPRRSAQLWQQRIDLMESLMTVHEAERRSSAAGFATAQTRPAQGQQIDL